MGTYRAEQVRIGELESRLAALEGMIENAKKTIDHAIYALDRLELTDYGRGEMKGLREARAVLEEK